MRRVRQREEWDCGVACVAMLAGVAYEEAAKEVEKSKQHSRARGTTTRMLNSALKEMWN